MDSDSEASMAANLRKAITSLRRVSQSGSIAESPHAVMGRLMSNARCSSWAWNASSIRLTQNLEDLRRWETSLNLDLQSMWDSWNSVTKAWRPCRRFMQRPVRERKTVSCSRIYHMGFMTTGDVVVPEHDGDEDQAAVVVADDDDPDEPPAPLPLGAFRPAIAGDSDGDEADTDVPHGPPLPPPAAPDAVVAVDGMFHPAGLVELCDEDCRLLRDFLEMAFLAFLRVHLRPCILRRWCSRGS